MQMPRSIRQFVAGLVILAYGGSVPAFANPVLSYVESGEISINESGGVYTIMASNGAIGIFSSFGNLEGQSIISLQASPDYTAMYRVIGTDPSVFFGSFTTNSQIFLVNPNGIHFAPGSQINASGLIASALHMTSENFLAKQFVFEGTGNGGFVLNEGAMTGGTLANYHLQYAIDYRDGSGFGAFKNLSYPRTGAGGSNGSTTITMTDTTGVNVNDFVFGTNVNGYTKVVSIDSGTAITVTNPNIGTVSGTLRFNQIPNETVADYTTGIRMKIRVKTVIANSVAATFLQVPTFSTDAARALQYPLDSGTLTLTNLVAGTEVSVYRTSDSEELDHTESSGTTYTFNYDLDTPTIDTFITITKPGYKWIRYDNQILDAGGLEIQVFQTPDLGYLNP